MNFTRKHFRTILLLVITIVASNSWGQSIINVEDYSGRQGLYLDYAQFRTDQEGLDRLEIYYRLFNSSLKFVKEGELYRSSYEITVTIYDNKGRQVTAFSSDKSFTVSQYKSTISEDDFRISQINRLLPPGKYKVDLQLLDKNSRAVIERSMKVQLFKYDKRDPHISGIELAQKVDTVIIDTVFQKGYLSIIPSVNRIYSGDTSASLLYYHEIYQGRNGRKDVTIETHLLDRKLDVVYRDSLNFKFGENEDLIRQVRKISLWGIKSGEHVLEIILRGRRDRIIDRIKVPFTIFWSPRAMVIHDYKRALKMLKYIGEGEELKQLAKLNSPEARLAGWEEFWLVRDPSPGTEENEMRRGYYNRIEYANRHFRILRREGWLTDRGMILIKFGEPDQIEDYPFELASKAYKIWYYYRLQTPRKFVFVDEWGDGDYDLQYPYDGRM